MARVLPFRDLVDDLGEEKEARVEVSGLILHNFEVAGIVEIASLKRRTSPHHYTFVPVSLVHFVGIEQSLVSSQVHEVHEAFFEKVFSGIRHFPIADSDRKYGVRARALMIEIGLRVPLLCFSVLEDLLHLVEGLDVNDRLSLH